MKSTRREFLKQTGVGLAGFSLLNSNAWSANTSAKLVSIPPHLSMLVPAVHGYVDQISAPAGGKLNFHISSTVPYKLSIYRLGHDPDSPAEDELVHQFKMSEPTPQPIHPGSYVQVEKKIGGSLKALTLECWVRPWKLGGWRGLVTQHDYHDNCGFGLFLSSENGVSFYLGNGGGFERANSHSTEKSRIKTKRWQHVVATWDGKEKSIWIDGELAGKWKFAGVVKGGVAPLRLGAYGAKGVADNFFDGDLAMTAVYDRALSPGEIKARFAEKGLIPAKGKDVLGCWSFAEQNGDRVADSTPHKRHGRIINHGTRMIGGPGFEHEVLRFADYTPEKDERRGYGLRLCSDDLYDCRWKPTHEYRIPGAVKSGMYVGRIEYEWEGKPHLYHITFVVRKGGRQKKAPIAVLASSNTWLAYNSTAFAKPQQVVKRVASTKGMANSENNPPAFSFYRRHSGGQGTYQVGFRMPFPGSDPYLLYGGPTSYSHLARAERFAQIWLEKSGYQYDLITDTDLHRDPNILRGYKVLLINGHSEYWSIPAYQGLENFLKNDGNAIVLSGNSLFWRVSYSEDGSVLECRKVDAPGEQMLPQERGESWHSHDAKRGGLLREAGYPGWRLIGLETLGWSGVSNYESFGPYAVEDSAHFLFNFPEKVELQPGEKFGFNEEGVSLANGHEFDIRLSTLAAMQEGASPAGASVPNDPAGKWSLVANGIMPWSKGGSGFDYFFRRIKPKNEQGGEMVYWERAEGGRVFNAGSIGAGWGIYHDKKFQALMRNVLFHFGVQAV
ncbi:MAG: LamG domain-containing protein [Verrucomicrobia bacterium]|nr:LamG domain-containing protein [Verrucomicrobiota bacterium]